MEKLKLNEVSDLGVQSRLVQRLRGNYAIGPHIPNGNPEFGWRQFQSPPIQHEAADRIDFVESLNDDLVHIINVLLDGGDSTHLIKYVEYKVKDYNSEIDRL